MLQSAASPKSATGPVSTNRACQNCARAKAKCLPQADGSGTQCARCFRLKKECAVLPRSVRKRRAPNTSTNTAQLEEKIESLVTLLAAAHGSANKADGLPSPTQTKSIQSTPSDSQQSSTPWACEPSDQTGESWKPQTQLPPALNVPDSAEQRLTNSWYPSFANNPPAPTSTPGHSQNYSRIEITGHDEDNLLSFFQEQFATRFPFIVIPPHMTSDMLRATKPYLHRAIMMVALQGKRAKQMEMARQISMDIAAALILSGERSLDMLQAMVVYNAWSYHYSPVVPQTQSTAMFQLSFALLFDLGLNRPVRENEGPEMLIDSSKHPVEMNPWEARRTLDERRAFLCCYILTSVIALYIKKTDGLPYSSYLDYNCKVIEETAACESDLVLAALARLQFITESFHRNVLSKTRDADMKAPSWMYIKAARSELHNTWTSFSPELRQNRLLVMNHHSIEIFLYEPSLQQNPTIGYTMGNPHRIEMLHACLTSSRALLDGFLAQPLSAYANLSVLELSHIGQGMSTVFKLSMVDEPGWDLAYIRKTHDPISYFDKFIANFEKVGLAIDQSQQEPCRHSFPTGCSMAMRKIKGVYEAKIAAETAQNVSEEQTGALGMGVYDQIDWMDDVYWQELLNDGNFLQ